MPKNCTCKKVGKGWEEEMAKAIARDKQTQEDKTSAAELMTAAKAESDRRIQQSRQRITK